MTGSFTVGSPRSLVPAWRKMLFLVVLLTLGACTKMEPTESGVIFRMLPPALGGGVSDAVIHQGQRAFLMPWEQVYRFDTATRDISWGAGRGVPVGDVLYTRASDGNEVALSVTIAYRIQPNPETLVKLVQEVATSNDGVRELVVSLARSHIRAAMNELGTFEFRQVKSRYDAIDQVKEKLNQALNRWGIEVVKVTLDDFQFARLGSDGVADTTYQEKINLIQQLIEETKRELSKKETVLAQKQQELATEQGIFDRKEAEAIGYRNQAQTRGDAYFEARSNDAKAILAKGKSEVEGIIAQINALKGSGGKAVLRLEIGRRLLANAARFIVMNDSTGTSTGGGVSDGVEVRRLDVNDLLSQLAVIEGTAEGRAQSKVVADKVPATTQSEVVKPAQPAPISKADQSDSSR